MAGYRCRMDVRTRPCPPAMSTSTRMSPKSNASSAAGIASALIEVIASLKTLPNAASDREHLEHRLAHHLFDRGLAGAQRVQQLGVNAEVMGFGEEVDDVACSAGLRAQQLRGQIGGKGARRLLFEHAEAGEHAHDAVERVLVRAGLPRQFRHRLGSGRQPIGEPEFERRMQGARAHIAPGDLESELRGGCFGCR